MNVKSVYAPRLYRLLDSCINLNSWYIHYNNLKIFCIFVIIIYDNYELRLRINSKILNVKIIGLKKQKVLKYSKIFYNGGN